MARPAHYEREREYPMTVAEAWQLLADTNHLNRSIGLPSVTFSPLDGAHGEFVREARTRAYGVVPVHWKEYPFAWVREREYVVRREFDWGPVSAVEGGVALHPAGGSVRVRAFADFTLANFTGALLWRQGTSVVRKTLEFCDEYLERKQQGFADPTPPAGRPVVDEDRLTRLLAQLNERPVAKQLVAPLAARIREADDEQVLRMRAFAVAGAWNADREATLQLFLHAASAGLLRLAWQLMCPSCRVPKGESGSLASLPARFHCDTCGIIYDTDLAQRVELRFSVNPLIRRASDAIYCIGGPLRMPHILAQQYLRANEARPLVLPASGKLLRLRAVGGRTSLRITPAPPARRSEEISLIYAAGKWTGPLSLTSVTPNGESLALPDGCSLLLRNQSASALLAVIEDVRWTGQATTAAAALDLPEFRALFPSEQWTPEKVLGLEAGAGSAAG